MPLPMRSGCWFTHLEIRIMERVNSKSIRRIVMTAAAPAALLLGAGTASAQWSAQQPQRYPQQQQQQQQRNRNQRQQSQYGQQELFEWQGPVDREIRIQMNGGRASVLQIGNNERTNGRVRAMAAVPTQDGIVTVQQLQGRGSVDVVQQPTNGNGYTTIIRLRDPDSGAGMYHIAAYWQPSGNSGVFRNGSRHGNGNRNGNGQYDNGDYGQHRDHNNW